MSVNTAEPTALASVVDFNKRYPELVEEGGQDLVQDVLLEATQHIEDRTGRRLAPFTGHVLQDAMFGIDPNEYGGNDNIPLSAQGSLGISLAQGYGFGAGNLVRHIWLDHFAPMRPELWTYHVQSIQIYTTFGGSQDLTNSGFLGPDSTDGHLWLRMGTFAPEGSRFQIIYDGGYTLGIPPALKRACLMQAVKFYVLDAEPQNRKDMKLDEIDLQISLLLGPWNRG
jgi:hypothetical protein